MLNYIRQRQEEKKNTIKSDYKVKNKIFAKRDYKKRLKFVKNRLTFLLIDYYNMYFLVAFTELVAYILILVPYLHIYIDITLFRRRNRGRCGILKTECLDMMHVPQENLIYFISWRVW